MTKHEISIALERAGLKQGRVLAAGSGAQTMSTIYQFKSQIVRSAAVVSARHGIVWRGDIDVGRERYMLRQVALESDTNLFVVDEATALAKNAKPAAEMMREALWWTRIKASDQDQFLPADAYERWQRKRRRPSQKAILPPGKNWESKLLLADECDPSQWLREISQIEGKVIAPKLLQRSGPYELVWFPNGQAVLKPVFHAVLGKYGKVEFSIHPDRQPIHARCNNRVVALIWPSQVPNSETAESALHEMAMTTNPPEDANLLKAIVLQQLRCGWGAEELHQATSRLRSWLEGRQMGSCNPLSGITEWEKCRAVEFDPICLFKGTSVPVTLLFQELERHKYISEFLALHPTVTREQVDTVLEHLVMTINFG